MMRSKVAHFILSEKINRKKNNSRRFIMAKIDLTVIPDRLERTIKRARERNIIVPTFAEMRDPSIIPAGIQRELKEIGLWDVHPRNLFRITWKNQPVAQGGGFGGVNYIELPPSLTGVPVRILGLVGNGSPLERTRWELLLAALCPDWCRGNLTRLRRKRSGRQPEIIAGVVPTIPPCWGVNRLLFCRKV